MKESIKKEIKELIDRQMLEVFIKLQDGFEVSMQPGFDTASYMADAAFAVFIGAVDAKEKGTIGMAGEYNGTELTKSSNK